VKYFRDHSARDCAQEEKEILEAEIDQMYLSFQATADAWQFLAKQELKTACLTFTVNHPSCTNCAHPQARSAYAFKQSEMYKRLAFDSQASKKRADEKCKVFDDWYKSLLLSRPI